MEAFSVLAGSETSSQPHAAGQDPLYRYSPVKNAKGTIRLLVLKRGTGNTIDCDLIESTIDEYCLPYEAVSYTWGPEFAATSIRIRGKMLPVTFHLSLILRDLRRPDTDRVIWVDAVCINQQDAVEKGHQVAQMKDIYRSASCVLLCICRPTDYTNLLMDSLGRLDSALRTTVSHDDQALETSWQDIQISTARRHLDPQSPDLEASLQRQMEALTTLQRQGLEYILNQPWFHRVWILQEVANASSAIVYCGDRFVSAAIFALGPKLLDAKIRSGDDGFVAEVLSLMPGPSRRDAFQDLYPLLQRFRGSQATIERDRIYALFGICQDVHIGTKINPDYVQSEKDVVHDTISYICCVEVSAVASISPINSISELLAELDDLDNTMLSHILYSNDHSSALSLLVHRGEYISVDAEMFDLASTDIMIKEGVVELLLQQRNADTLLSGWGTWTTTWVAAEYGHDALAKSMLAKVSDIESPGDGSPQGIRRFPEAKGGIANLVTLLHNITEGTRLYRAATSGNTNLVTLLLEAGASLEDQSGKSQSPLSSAAENGHMSVVQLLVKHGADVNFQDLEGITPLSAAAQNGHIAIVQLLMDNGADLNPQAIGALTPLSLAAENGHETMVRFLLKSGAYFSLKDEEQGSEPLRMAASHGQEAIVRILLATGANDDDKNPAVLEAALCDAAIGFHPSTLRCLFDSGATADAEGLSDMLETVLAAHAIQRGFHSPKQLQGQEITTRMLLEKGARSGKALCWAALGGSEKLVQVLLEHGAHEANINQEFRLDVGDGENEHAEGTPLAFAAQGGDEHVVKLLLAYGADPNVQNSEGETAISWAERVGEWDIVEILLSEGATMEVEGVEERTELVIDS